MADGMTGLDELRRWTAETLAEGLKQALNLMTSSAAEIDLEQPASLDSALAGEERWLWWEQQFNGLPGGVVWTAAAGNAWLECGRLALSAAGIDDASEQECASTWNEIQGQALSGLAQALTRRLQREITCAAGAQLESAPNAAFVIPMRVRLGELNLTIGLAWNDAFARALTAPEPAAEPAAAPKREAVQQPAAASIENSRTLGLLLEVELPLSVSFGRTYLPLKDVVKLSSGSIIELNRSINEPVELIINNCVIAKGEVVVVEGNYGVRIKQIVSREERLRTLF